MQERVTPSLAAAVGTLDEGTPRYVYAKGDALFDLASLTKIIATTALCAAAIEQGRLSLYEAPFPRWSGVTIKEILQHSSGLPAWDNFYAKGRDKQHTLDLALSAPIDVNQRSKTVYSDIGFIALGNLLEKRFKRSLGAVFADMSSRHFGARSLSFSSHSGFDWTLAAPTGFCPFRRRHLVGEVNDLNAFALGQEAGHAGLFGTVHDVSRAARFFLESHKQPKTNLQKTLFAFMNAKGERAIGFDRASKTGSTGGALSQAAIGHLGFTGTSLWIDPEANNNKGAYFVLLTNYLERWARKQDIKLLRQDFHRAAIRLFRN